MANPTLTQSLTARTILGKRSVSIDPALNWDMVNYNIGAITLRWDPSGRAFAEVGVKPRDYFPAYKNGTLPVIYLSNSGNDTTGNGTINQPYATLVKAFTVINTAGVPYVISMQAGTYTRTNGGTSGMITTLNVSGCVMEAYGGSVTITTHDNLSWTQNTTYSWVYQTNRSTVGSAIWLDRPMPNRNGLYQEARWVSSLVECSRQPGSMYTDGTVLYAYHHTGAAVTNNNTRVFLHVPNVRVSGTTQLSFLMTGKQAGDYFELQGGSTGGFSAIFTGGAGGAKVVVGLEQVRMRYNSNQATANGTPNQPNALTVEGVNGLFYAYNCDASGGGNDNWNPHNVLNADMSYLTVNCSGIDAGRFNSVSCNGLTWHDANIKIVDIAGYYSAARGGTCTAVGSSTGHLIGTVLEKSVGDRGNGGGYDPQELSVYDSAICYGDYVQLRPWNAGGSTVVAGGTGKIILRNTLPFAGGARNGTSSSIDITYLK